MKTFKDIHPGDPIYTMKVNLNTGELQKLEKLIVTEIIGDGLELVLSDNPRVYHRTETLRFLRWYLEDNTDTILVVNKTFFSSWKALLEALEYHFIRKGKMSGLEVLEKLKESGLWENDNNG